MNHRKPVTLFMIILGTIILAGIYVAALSQYNKLDDYLLYFAKGLYVYVVVYVVILVTVTKAYGGYEMGIYRTSEIVFSQILAATFVNLVTYLQISLIAKAFLRIDYLAAMSLAQYVFIACWTVLSIRLYHKAFRPGRMILVFGGPMPEGVVQQAAANTDRFELAEVVDEAEALRRIEERTLNGCESVMICGTSPAFGAAARQYCFEHNMRLYIVPWISDITAHNTRLTGLGDIPLLVCRNDVLGVGQAIAKRAVDIAGSLIILTVLSPFMAITAAAIRLYDGGPALYAQERLTRDGRVFRVLKFRSMVQEAERDGKPVLARKKDSRITPVGAFIRRIRFDEVPQFINVLKGEMSIVGPRPERPEIAARYEQELPEFRYRLKMKAGITGYAQVYGNYTTTPRDKLMMDIIYINSYSILRDIELIFLTMKIVFIPEKTQGL